MAGNAVTEMQNRQQIFSVMLRDIDDAKSSIDLEMYIFRSGRIGQRFIDAMAARAREGVPVHVLADWIGSRDDANGGRQLRAAGVHFHFFRGPNLRSLDRMNNRTHGTAENRVAYGRPQCSVGYPWLARHRHSWMIKMITTTSTTVSAPSNSVGTWVRR